MNLTLFITSGCGTCEKVKSKLNNLVKTNPQLVLQIEDIQSVNSKNIIIVPALFVEDTLFAYGEFDISRLNSYINLLS